MDLDDLLDEIIDPQAAAGKTSLSQAQSTSQ